MQRWIRFIALFLLLAAILAIFRWLTRESPDEIHLLGKAVPGSAAIFIDGRREAGCFDDEVVRATDTVAVGNILSATACGSRVAVLVQDNAMHFDGSVSAWTDDGGDVPRDTDVDDAAASHCHLGSSGNDCGFR